MAQTVYPIFRYIVRSKAQVNPHSAGILGDALALGLDQIKAIQCNDLYFIQGALDKAQLDRLGLELLSDPVSQNVEWSELNGSSSVQDELCGYQVEVALRPGVTDPVAEQIVRAAHEIGLRGVQRASTAQQFWVKGEHLTPALLDQLARRLLSNAVIQRYALGEIDPAFPEPAEASGCVETIPIRVMSSDQLLACSAEHRAALDLVEMQAIQAYFRQAGRDCSDVELECIAQTWSEHCVHKTFKSLVTLESAASPGALPYPPSVDNLLNSYIRKATQQINAPWVISAFTDNAGIIDFDADYEVSFKVETHNHPSAIEPFGGANTGVGGVIRDVIGVSARPIANTDVLCFGPQNLPLKQLPEGVLHPRLIQSGVIAGVQDYGNKMGIPTVNGAIWYDPGFTANPLVFCGCVGLAPKGRHVRTPQVGDRLILLGGRTGRDGLRGATFSSQPMDAQTGQVAGASVQIGDPITEKITLEVIVRARDEGLYHAITDCGAGGLSSAVGEMTSEIGAEVDLAQVRLKYPGLAPWEIWLSEAQERMVIAVPPGSLIRLQEICDLYEVELTDIGYFTGSGKLVVAYAGKPVLDLDNQFLHHGLPQRHLKAIPPSPQRKAVPTFSQEVVLSQALLDLLSHPNIASKARAIRIYDHEVQGGTRVKPLTGRENDGPSDACVIKPAGTQGTTGIVLSNGINPEYGKRDSYNMAVSVVDEAIRNAVAVGADPQRMAILDNFCWGDPKRPEVMWSLLEAARGCHDAALVHAAPFISGKDSFNNEYQGSSGERVSIPATLLISALGIIADTGKSVTMDLKTPGDLLFLVGEFRPTLGGSHFSLVTGRQSNQPTPCASELAPQVYRVFHKAVQAGWVRAAHDLSEGGLGVAAAEMAIGGRQGVQIDTPDEDPLLSLYCETNGCLLVEVPAEISTNFTNLFGELPCQPVGWVTTESVLTASHRHQEIFWLPLHHLVEAWTR
jgi:phosphoribosylformylglycinamidine synthase subunit PurSL